MRDSSKRDDREIVVAVVSPLGCPIEDTLSAIDAAFVRNGFTVARLRISHLLDSALPDLDGEEALTRTERLMNKGDRFRKLYSSDAACGYMAAQAIAAAREAETGSEDRHRTRTVTLMRSLKTPGEVKVLREVYGQRLIVVGVGASKEKRRKQLVRELAQEIKKSEAKQVALRLLERDEKDELSSYGQRTRDAYKLADAFIAVSTLKDAKVADRLVDLLLGEPYGTPTKDEQGMFGAWAAKFRSSAAGRQVGAAITDSDGEIVALGCNDVPRPGGGQYWPDDPDDSRDFQLGHDANDRGKFGAAESLLAALAEAEWLAPGKSGLTPRQLATEALDGRGPLAHSEIADLIEFGRIVHAEMAALMTAARNGRAVRGCTLFTTTYPCHECARLIIAAGIARICFIDPYPKSRAGELYEGILDEDGRPGTIPIQPFVGVSPRMFPRVFEMSHRDRDVEGSYVQWTEKHLIVAEDEISDSIPSHERAAVAFLQQGATSLSDEDEAGTPES
ncbi:MAG: hypothetical protein IT193_20005 [Propionibacteriaceae bacterium]|nr:hypothetical protein [Propionibacteriaceae bacterium]